MPPGGGRYGPHGMQTPNHGPVPGYGGDPRLYHPASNQNVGGHPGFANAGPTNALFGQGPGAGNAGIHGNFAGGGGGFGANGTGLASHASVMAFAHGAALQEQQAYAPVQHGARKGHEARIRDVWSNNLESAMADLRQMIDRYPYISVDSMFPGVIARPIGNFKTKADYHYQTVRCNADLLKMVQLGITIWTPEMELPPPQGNAFTQTFSNGPVTQPCTWQFNFQFDPNVDMASEDYLNLLKKSGYDFERARTMGIDIQQFGSLLITSGLVLTDDITWVTFHSGYDFAYLIKIMIPKPLPSEEDQFYMLVAKFFPKYWDGKTIIRQAQKLAAAGQLGQQGSSIVSELGNKGGLEELAGYFGLSRPGNANQAGPEAWLCGLLFQQIRQKVFESRLPEEFANQMWGLNGVGEPASAASRAAALASQGHQASGNGAMGFHPSGTPHGTHRENLPSTPTTGAASLATTTPGPHLASHPGGGAPGMIGGQFGQFRMGGHSG